MTQWGWWWHHVVHRSWHDGRADDTVHWSITGQGYCQWWAATAPEEVCHVIIMWSDMLFIPCSKQAHGLMLMKYKLAGGRLVGVYITQLVQPVYCSSHGRMVLCLLYLSNWKSSLTSIANFSHNSSHCTDLTIMVVSTSLLMWAPH